MNKTLTAMVMAGAVALGACKTDVHNAEGEHIRKNYRDDYTVTVTDQERSRIGGTLPREVDVLAADDDTTPYRVTGYTDNALAPNAQFTSGRIRYMSAFVQNCYWGPQAPPPLCTATEVKNAQQMLTKYAAFATK